MNPVGVNVECDECCFEWKEVDDLVLVKLIVCEILVRLIVSVTMPVKLMNSQLLKIVYVQNVALVNQYQHVEMKNQIQLKPHNMIKK